VDNDKTFAACALILVLGVVSMLSAAVMVLGDGTWPSPLSFAEHVALGLMMRAGYKTIGGFHWADWSIAGDRVRVVEEMLPAGQTAMG
jgi:hypothetical protein